MKRKYIKAYSKLLAMIMAAVLVLPLSTPVLAAESANSNNRTEFNFINVEDYDNIEYTYVENENTYHVYESINDSFTEVHTKIYVINESEEVLIDEFIIYLETVDGTLYVSKYVDEVLVDRSEVGQVNQVNFAGSGINLRVGRYYDGMLYYDGSTNRFFTGWYYDYTSEGSNYIPVFTYSVVISVLTNLLIENQVVSVVIEEIAQKILEEKMPIIYWTQEVYHVNQISYPERQLYGSFVGQKVYMSIYSDSERNDYLGTEVQEWHDPEEWPSRINIGPA